MNDSHCDWSNPPQHRTRLTAASIPLPCAPPDTYVPPRPSAPTAAVRMRSMARDSPMSRGSRIVPPSISGKLERRVDHALKLVLELLAASATVRREHAVVARAVLVEAASERAVLR
jgi:hypothetical protein